VVSAYFFPLSFFLCSFKYRKAKRAKKYANSGTLSFSNHDINFYCQGGDDGAQDETR
jgi:hypothetical protein